MEAPIPFLNVTAASELLPIPSEDLDLDRCKLLGPVALIVQAVMGVIVLGGLVIKRMREKPRRKWKIWLADVGKQVVGQFAVHLSNVAISDLIATNRADNPCSLYALNILIDTTLGVLLIYFLLQFSTQLMQRYQAEYKTGYYGTPFSFSLWAEQAAVYVACLAVMKIVVVVVFWIAPELEDGMSWGLSWIENEEAQVVVVMLILPLVMNLFQFLMVDSIIRSKDPASPSMVNENADEEALRRGFLETDLDDDDEEQRSDQLSSSRRGSQRRSMDGDEYLDLAGGNEDEDGKQKQATELLFDAESPTAQRQQSRHAYPPSSIPVSSALPPYSPYPPQTSVSPKARSSRDNFDHWEEEGARQEEDDDGWGQTWGASSDVEEEPIPMQRHLPLRPTPPSNNEPLPPTMRETSAPSAIPHSKTTIAPLPSSLPDSNRPLPIDPFSQPKRDSAKPTQSQAFEQPATNPENGQAEEEEEGEEWGFGDDISEEIDGASAPVEAAPTSIRVHVESTPLPEGASAQANSALS